MIKTKDYSTGECDLHLHTIVSDGEMTPADILTCAKSLNLRTISITDHDAVGAYIHFGDIIQQAEEMGLSLIPGIELDSYYEEVEIHVLGYGIDIHHEELNRYLSYVHSLRRQRIKEQIVKINRYYNKELIKEEEIFIPSRDTLMNPHLVHLLLRHGLFSGYKEAARWISANAKSSVTVPKPSTAEMINLVKKAGGRAFMAHPGYYIFESGLNIDKMIQDLQPVGLDGMETEFPYLGTGSKFQTRESVREVIESFKRVAHEYGLAVSRGSDAHTVPQMTAFNT